MVVEELVFQDLQGHSFPGVISKAEGVGYQCCFIRMCGAIHLAVEVIFRLGCRSLEKLKVCLD